jgi:iron complex outermembrane receptor protein
VTGSTGDQQHDLGVRYGAELKNDADFRIYAKRDNYDATKRGNGVSASDAWHKTQGGFRLDTGSATDGITVQGDAYDGDLNPTLPDTQQISGANLLTRWSGTTASGSRQTVRFYYDGTRRHAPGIFKEQLNTFDFLAQQDTRVSENHNVIAGASYRFAQDRMVNGNLQTFLPEEKNLRWASLFAQDDVSLPAKTRASLGLRTEYNVYTHWELLPSLRLSHKMTLRYGVRSHAQYVPPAE